MGLTKHGFGDLLPDDEQKKTAASKEDRERLLADVAKENEEQDDE